MPQGLEVYNASGQVILSITDRTARFIGSFLTGGNETGSVTVPGLAGYADPISFSVSTNGNAGVYGGPEITFVKSGGLTTGVVNYAFNHFKSGPQAPTPNANARYYNVFVGVM